MKRRSEDSDVSDELYRLLESCIGSEASVAELRCRWNGIAKRLPARLSTLSEVVVDLSDATPRIDAVEHHCECLSTIDWAGATEQGVPLKVIYHLRLLGNALGPDAERFEPTVSIVVAVHNGADFVAQAIESALAQSHRNVEIVVVDDGSTDATGQELERFAGRIAQERIAHSGVSVARNRGLEMATGEFVAFLDADDALTATAIARMVDAFRATCDARICVAPSEIRGGEEPFRSDLAAPPRFEDPASPLGDPMRAAVDDFPLHSLCALAPRWLLRQVGPFELDLRQSEAARYWFRMASFGLKVIALRTPCLTRSFHAECLTLRRVDALGAALEADFRTASDLAREPRSYRYLVPLVDRIEARLDEAQEEGMPAEELDRFDRRLTSFASTVGYGIPSADGPTTILLDQWILSLRQRQPEGAEGLAPLPSRTRARLARLYGRIEGRGRLGSTDLRRWLPELQPQPFDTLADDEQAALAFALRQLHLGAFLGTLPLQLRSLERLGADFPGHPYEGFWRTAASLASVVGAERARRICRHRFFRSGWNWYDRTKRLLQRPRTAA